MADEPEKAGQGDEGGKGQEPAKGGTDEGGSEEKKEEQKKSDQPTPNQSEDESGKQKSGQPFQDLDAANKSYGNLLRKHQETTDELKETQKTKSGEGGDDVSAEVSRQLTAQREAELARTAETNTRTFFRNNPELLKDAETLSEMEAITNERPDLLKLDDPMTVIHAMAEQRVGKVRVATAQQEQESAERASKNNEAKSKTTGHSHGASSKEYETTDRADDTSELTPEQRDEYARAHQFDE